MRHQRNAWIAILAGVALLGAAGTASAQQKVSIEGRGGIGIPAGDLADLEDVGPSFGVGLAYWIQPRLAIRVDGDVDILSGVDADGSGPEAPDMNVWHYNIGLAYRLTDPQTSRWKADVNAGLGGSTLDVDPFSVGGQSIDFSETYFSLNGGLKIGYDVTPTVNVYLGGQAYLVFTDDAETAVFSQLRSDVNAFDTAWTIPITAGVSLRL